MNQEKADTLNTFFTSVYKYEDLNTVPVIDKYFNVSVLQHIEISETEIFDILNSLKSANLPALMDCTQGY